MSRVTCHLLVFLPSHFSLGSHLWLHEQLMEEEKN